VNIVNGFQNVNDNYRIGLDAGISRWNDKPFSFGFNVSANRNFSSSSINKGAVTRFWSFGANPNINYNLKKQKIYLSLEGDFNIYQRTSAFQNQRNIFIINGNVRKAFTTKDALEIKLSVNDLFNQNLGIQRNITSNFVQENTFQNLRRFFLLSFVWNFNKNGKPSEF
jgi:hypothetical protein